MGLSETVSMNMCIFRHAVGLSGGAPPPSPPPHASTHCISQSSVRKLWGLRRAPRSSSHLMHHSVFLSCTIQTKLTNPTTRPLQRADHAGVEPLSRASPRKPAGRRARARVKTKAHGPA